MEVEPKRLVVGFVLIFLLGVMFAIVNGVYAERFNESLPLVVYAISFVSVIVGGIIVALFQMRINKTNLKKAMRLLPPAESKIISLLIENGNALEQNRLVALSGLNRVKVSRILQDFESRGAVKRTNLGNTKLVVLRV